MSDKYDSLMEVIQKAVATTEGVKAAVRPSDLGLRGGAGTLVVMYEDGETIRLNIKDATPAENDDSEE